MATISQTGPANPSPERAVTMTRRPLLVQVVSTGLANMGDGITLVLVPLVAVALGASPSALGLVSAAAWLPWLLLGLPGGSLVDRVDRRNVQGMALLARAVVLTVGAAAALNGLLTVPLLVALVLALGVTEVLADLGASAIVPDLVPADRLAAANGQIQSVQQVTNSFLGGPLAGLLLLVGAWAGLGVAGLFAAVAAVVVLYGLRGRSYRPANVSPAHAKSRVRAGLAYLAKHPVLLPMTMSGSLINFALTAYMTVFVLWVVEGPFSVLHLRAELYPLVMTASAAGAVAGSLLASRLAKRFGQMQVMQAFFILGAALMIVPVLIPTTLATVLAFTAVGLVVTAGNVLSQSLRQQLVPAELLGRVTGASRALSFGLMPLGALAGGQSAELWGLSTTLSAAAVISLVVIVAMVVRLRTSAAARRELDRVGAYERGVGRAGSSR